jgi:hypothetical protein
MAVVQKRSAAGFQNWASMAHQQGRFARVDQREEEEKQGSQPLTLRRMKATCWIEYVIISMLTQPA